MNKIKIHTTNFIRQVIDEDLASGKCKSVHTRFSPEPNGYLHIGHAKSICLNFDIARDYNGKCNLRFDDTNPVKENKEYVDSIKYDVQWLGFNWNGKVHYSSDYFNQLYNYALELIDKGLAYVDQLSIEEIREYRGTLTTPGKNSPYRDRSIKENHLLFVKMRNGEFIEGSACLRAKIDMSSPFIIMRDPILYRIKSTKHYRFNNMWCIYPMYDFTHCISDALEGITHSLCTLEFQDNRQLYNWILDNITIDTHPKQYEFSRLNLKYSIMSKRKLNLLVTKKIVDGWDDPRMPTISGLRRRGYTASSIREFCRRIGITKQNSNIEISILEECIREDLNERALRVMAVINPVRIIIESLPEKYEQDILMPNHPNKPEMGKRLVAFSREIYIDRADFREKASNQYKRLVLGKEVRLRNSYIIKAQYVEKDNQGQITTIICIHDPNTLNKKSINNQKVKGVIHWVSATRNVSAEFRLYDRLFNKVNPAAEKDFLSTINPNSLVIFHGFIETSILTANTDEPIQFEREGYFYADYKYSNTSYLVFNRTVGLRNNKKNRIDL